MVSFIINGIGLAVPQHSITHVAEAVERFTGSLRVGMRIQAVVFIRTRVSPTSTFVRRSWNRGGYGGRLCDLAVWHLPGFPAFFCLVVPDVRGAGVVPGCAKEALAVFRFATVSWGAVLVRAFSIFGGVCAIYRAIYRVIAYGSILDISSLHCGQEKQTYKQHLVTHHLSY